MRTYLETLITEKGESINAEVTGIEHSFFGDAINLRWNDVIDFIETQPEHHQTIKSMLSLIDSKNDDVFDYLRHIASAMINPCQNAA